MERTQFTFYESFYKAIKMLKKTEQADAFLAICEYALYGKEPEISGSSSAIFMIARPILDASRKKAEGGTKGKRKKKVDEIPVSSEKDIDKISETRENGKQEKEQVKEQMLKEIKKKFVPPEVSEVEDFVKEKNYHIDPEAFVAFYASKGWKVGSSPMKDWKAAVLTWERKYKADHPFTTNEPEPVPVLDPEEFNRRWQDGC